MTFSFFEIKNRLRWLRKDHLLSCRLGVLIVRCALFSAPGRTRQDLPQFGSITERSRGSGTAVFDQANQRFATLIPAINANNESVNHNEASNGREMLRYRVFSDDSILHGGKAQIGDRLKNRGRCSLQADGSRSPKATRPLVEPDLLKTRPTLNGGGQVMPVLAPEKQWLNVIGGIQAQRGVAPGDWTFSLAATFRATVSPMAALRWILGRLVVAMPSGRGFTNRAA